MFLTLILTFLLSPLCAAQKPFNMVPYAAYKAIALHKPAAAARPMHTSNKSEQYAQDIACKFPTRKRELEKACELFEKTPGFLKALKILARCQHAPSAEGYWYELEKALALHHTHCHSCQQKVIKSFGAIIQSPQKNTRREFDIIAHIDEETRYYECKNVQWTAAKSQLSPQFLDQQTIVADLATLQKNNVYIVSSKRPIPPQWKKFFEEQAIMIEVD